jgi:hypothetical protein
LATPWGFPCCVRFPCVHAVATTPAQRRGSSSLIAPRRISLPRKGCRVGLRNFLFEACSAFTRVTACTLALSPIRDTLSEGFSYFVTSIAAPVASGWSDCRVGLAPTEKRRLCTAHTHFRTDEMEWLPSRSELIDQRFCLRVKASGKIAEDCLPTRRDKPSPERSRQFVAGDQVSHATIGSPSAATVRSERGVIRLPKLTPIGADLTHHQRTELAKSIVCHE